MGPLVLCPGFWVGDVIGTCEFVSFPPLCTQTFFWKLWRLPPQYQLYDEANPFPQACPHEDMSGIDAADDPSLYDELGVESQSPILEEAEAFSGSVPQAVKLPWVG